MPLCSQQMPECDSQLANNRAEEAEGKRHSWGVRPSDREAEGGQGRAKLGHERGKARCRGGRWLGVGALLLCSEGELGALGGVVEGDWSASRLLGQDR